MVDVGHRDPDTVGLVFLSVQSKHQPRWARRLVDEEHWSVSLQVGLGVEGVVDMPTDSLNGGAQLLSACSLPGPAWLKYATAF